MHGQTVCRCIWNDIWSNKRREFTKHHYEQHHLGQSEDWIVCVYLATCACNIWCNILSLISRSIRRHFKCSADMLIQTFPQQHAYLRQREGPSAVRRTSVDRWREPQACPPRGTRHGTRGGTGRSSSGSGWSGYCSPPNCGREGYTCWVHFIKVFTAA